MPVPFGGGFLVVTPLPEEDTHALLYDRGERKLELARHPSGFSCHELSKCIRQHDMEGTLQQMRCIKDCGGTVCDAKVLLEFMDACE